MSAKVTNMRGEPPTGIAKVGDPCSAEHWKTIGGIANWVNGHGQQLVPVAAGGAKVDAGDTRTFRFRCKPSARAIARVWTFYLRDNGSQTTATIKAPSTTTNSISVPVSPSQSTRPPHVYVEDLTSKSDTETAITCSVQADAGGDVFVTAVGCYEQTRSQLNLDTTDWGADTTTTRPRLPVRDKANASLSGCADAVRQADARRPLWQWAVYGNSPLTVVSTAGSPLTVHALDIPIVAAKDLPADTTREIQIRLFAYVSGGTGTVRFASSSPATQTDISVTTSGSGNQWHSDTLGVKVEDIDEADGLRSSAWPELTVTAWVDAGQTLYLTSMAAFPTGTPI